MEEQNRSENPWAWVPVVPRNLIVASWLVFVAVALNAVRIETITHPGQTWDLTLWQAIGGGASGVSYWLVLGSYLTSEVIAMILTLRKNRDNIDKAAAKTAAADAAAAAARQEVQAWQTWYESAKDDLDQGRPPQTPPPSGRNGSNSV